eukprot:jgi/Chlat1/7853/Chrsp66S07299
MRVGRAKAVRRGVRFFRVCFGFREPYKALVDGTFLHHALSLPKVAALRESLPKFLGATTKVFVTRCVTAELKALGTDYAGTAKAARVFEGAKCSHDTPVPAAACIQSLVANGNPEHFFIASQDAALKQQLHKVPGVAIVSIQNGQLHLEAPSETQRKLANMSEAEKVRASEAELKRAALKVAELVQQPVEALTGAPAIINKRKRKGPKGPNPLSVKKKKGPVQPSTEHQNSTKSRKRQRVRNGHSNQA